MAINTDTFLEIKGFLDQALGDFLEVDTTTNIAAGVTVVSTSLRSYDEASDDYFNGWWVEITEGSNLGVVRKVADYATATGTLTVYGANLAAEAGAVTIRVHRYDPTHKDNAIKRAIHGIYPSLNIPIDNQTLITGNMLPDGHFESWSSTSALNHWSATNITLAQTSTAGLFRGGKYSAKCTASAANGYILVNSDTYPQLLDFQGKSVDAYVWAYPEVADDATIVIYTKQADGTTQTLTSTTACPAGEWTLLALTAQGINDDLVDFQVRLKVTTDTKYVYFDDCYVGCERINQYYLPDDFYEGGLLRVFSQTNSNSDPAYADLKPFSNYEGLSLNFTIESDGSYKYLILKDIPTNQYRLRLLGDKPLETPTAFTSTITIDSQRMDYLIAKARMIFWEREVVPVSTDEKSKFEVEYQKAYRDFVILSMTKQMKRKAPKIKGA